MKCVTNKVQCDTVQIEMLFIWFTGQKWMHSKGITYLASVSMQYPLSVLEHSVTLLRNYKM